jgi:hypothetical protein
MTNAIFHYAQKIADNAYYMVWGYELKATPENLKWALQQNKNDILKYKFKDSFHAYTILEFAIKCGDLSAARTVVESGADLEYSPASGMGSILHFYMDCLEENTPPNLELLNFVIDNISDINVEEAGYFRTPLECALENMSHYKKIHWSVIEVLLQRGSRITENEYTSRTPFAVLKDAHSHKIQYGHLIRSYEEEIIFLDHLIEYAKLEKKYYVNSNSSLTLEEFKLHTSNLQAVFSRAAISMSCSSFISEAVNSLSDDLQRPDFLEETDIHPSDEEIAEFKQLVISCKNDFYRQNKRDCSNIGHAFILYHKYFQSLVKEGDFKECFESWQLASILPAIKKNVSAQTNILLRLLDLWGLTQKI